MMKNILALAIGTGLGFCVANALMKKKERDIFTSLEELKELKDEGKLDDEQYGSMLEILKGTVDEKEERRVNQRIEDIYGMAVMMAEEYEELQMDISEKGCSSLAEYIVKFPEDAYLNGVISIDVCCDDEQVVTEESAAGLAQTYISKLKEEGNRLIDETKMLGGDVERVKAETEKINMI